MLVMLVILCFPSLVAWRVECPGDLPERLRPSWNLVVAADFVEETILVFHEISKWLWTMANVTIFWTWFNSVSVRLFPYILIMASKSKTKQVCHAIRVSDMTAHELSNAAEIVNIAWALNCLAWKDDQAGWQFPLWHWSYLVMVMVSSI